jgi:hypothetical protein
MSRQHGQSMTEFAIGVAVMAMLLLGTITIAGYQEVQRRAAIAAREAAFAGVWTGRRSSPVTATSRAAQASLVDPRLINAVGQAYVGSGDIHVQAAHGAAPGRAATAAQVMVDPLRVAGGFLGAGFDLSAEGMLTGSIDVSIPADPDLPQPFSTMPLQLRQPFALLGNAWNAGGTQQVRDRTASLVPASVLTRLNSLWQPLLAPLSLLEPSLSRLCLGIIEPDRVPEDRLGAGRTPLPGRCP